MFSQMLRRCHLVFFALLVLAPAARAQDDGFLSAGDFPWVGWVGPYSDGLHGLRFGMTGFEVNRVMREKNMEPARARPFTLRFEGQVLGAPAELVAGFTTASPSNPRASLRVVQIRWLFRGLPQRTLRQFESLDKLLTARYGQPVHTRDDGVNALETGAGRYERLYYGQQARAWLEIETVRIQEFAVLIRIECPQLPVPKDD